MPNYPINCSTCEFNFSNYSENGITKLNDGICAGGGSISNTKKDTYGMPIIETEILFPNGCDAFDWDINAFFGKPVVCNYVEKNKSSEDGSKGDI